jgi:hypothetical protein
MCDNNCGAEVRIFSTMCHKRQKCLDFLASHKVHKLSPLELQKRMNDIHEWERLLSDMWTRLEMDVRKGDLSSSLKAQRTPAENWFFEHVMPPAFLQEFLMVTTSNGEICPGSVDNKS